MKDTVSTVLISKENCFILQQRDNRPDIKYPGMLMNFGGSIEEGEEPIDAIVREIQEELGIQLSEEDFILIRDAEHKNYFDEGNHKAYLFVAKNIDRSLLVLREGKAIVYIPVDDLKNLSALYDRTREELELTIAK